MQSRKNRRVSPSCERLVGAGESTLELPLEGLVAATFGVPDGRPIRERLGALPVGAASVTLPLQACLLGKPSLGWQRVGSLRIERGRVTASFFGRDEAFEPAWRVATGQRANTGEAKAVLVFAVFQAGRPVVLGQARLTGSRKAAGREEVREGRRGHPLLGGGRPE
jgi:hypothetical protein